MQNTGFLEELRWRNMLQDYTPGLEAYLAEGVRSAYIGFDPTAKSLGLGNYVQIMLLTHFQRAGHRPIVLMGGATGRIGDPSGKDQERELKSYEELEENIRFQSEQLKALLAADGPVQSVVYVNNYDFYKGMNVLDFLRDVGKHTTINYMLSKESVKKRLETGISFTEFSYQLLQAYDFFCLYKQHDCRIQMGGSDQWGNITAGTEYIGKTIADAKAYAVTTPLLTKADGKKFGKSEDGNIWLDPKMTSPYKFYQFWINCDDGMLDKLFRYFSLKPRTEIEQLLELAETNPRELKKVLAEEITLRIHGDRSLKQVMSVSELMFNKDCTSDFLFGMELDALIQVGEELPRYSVVREQFLVDPNVIQLLAGHTSILASKSEARRSIQGNAISINKRKISNPEEMLGETDLIRNRFILVENGKKNKYFVELTSS